jgi:hypothetical protein
VKGTASGYTIYDDSDCISTRLPSSGLGWVGLGWVGVEWFGLVWFGLVWFGLVRSFLFPHLLRHRRSAETRRNLVSILWCSECVVVSCFEHLSFSPTPFVNPKICNCAVRYLLYSTYPSMYILDLPPSLPDYSMISRKFVGVIFRDVIPVSFAVQQGEDLFRLNCEPIISKKDADKTQLIT